jgi:hypothetical protein
MLCKLHVDDCAQVMKAMWGNGVGFRMVSNNYVQARIGFALSNVEGTVWMMYD